MGVRKEEPFSYIKSALQQTRKKKKNNFAAKTKRYFADDVIYSQQEGNCLSTSAFLNKF